MVSARVWERKPGSDENGLAATGVEEVGETKGGGAEKCTASETARSRQYIWNITDRK